MATTRLDRQGDDLRAVIARVPGGIGGLTCAQDVDLVDLIRAAQTVVRTAEGIVAMAAGEVDRRSQVSGQASMSERFGARSARGLVAATAGVGFGAASQAVAVGQAIRPRTALSGEQLPAQRQHVAAAVTSGALSVGLAALIGDTLRKVAHVLMYDGLEVLEQALVEQAICGTWSVADFTAYCKRLPNRLDPDGAQPRDEKLRAKASITEMQLANGMLRVVMELDPELAGFWPAAIRTKTNPKRQAEKPAKAEGTKPTPM